MRRMSMQSHNDDNNFILFRIVYLFLFLLRQRINRVEQRVDRRKSKREEDCKGKASWNISNDQLRVNWIELNSLMNET